MREDPGLEVGAIVASLETHYGIDAVDVAHLALGYDFAASVYEVRAADGTPWFLKVRSGPVSLPSLEAPRALIDRGIPNILAPARTRSHALWAPLVGYPDSRLILYPFIQGTDVMTAGMSDDQWRVFGATLRAVHDSGLEETFRDRLRVEDFALPSAALVRQLLALDLERPFPSPAAARFAAFWREQAGRIGAMLERAGALGRSLQARPLPHVLCHADIHAANILRGEDGRIWLIDWDGPLVAPRERDLLFVIGSIIARTVEPREEELFFAGYGPVQIDPEALIYYRYERIIEDIGVTGEAILIDGTLGEREAEDAVDLVISFFASGADIDHAEAVSANRWFGR